MHTATGVGTLSSAPEGAAPPTPAPAGAVAPRPTATPRARWVFTACLALFTLVFFSHNVSLFTRQIHEDGDAAANSILIARAKRLELLVGNYSRIGAHHPGPALLYVLAGSEVLFYDLLKAVPTPHNAHILGVMLFNALLLALSLAVLYTHFRSPLAAGTAAAVFLAYFAVNGSLASGCWMPFLYFTPFLLLLVATASVAAGEGRHLPWLALAGGLLVHGHVCFAAFVVPLALYALIALARAHGFAVRRLLSLHAGPAVAFTALVALFLLPIAVHTIRNYPGEFRAYLDYVHTNSQRPGPGDVVLFVLQVFTLPADALVVPRPAGALDWACVLAPLAVLWAVRATWPRPADGPRYRYTRQVLAACGLATAAMVYYAYRGIDWLGYTYAGIFFGAVMLLLVTIAALNAALRYGVDRRRRAVLAGLAAAGLAAAVAGRFANDYVGTPSLAEVADRLEAGEGADRPIVLTYEKEAMEPFLITAGLVVELERRGRRVFVAEPALEHVYTAQHTCGREGLAGARHLEIASVKEPGRRGRHVVYQNATLSIHELDPHSRPDAAQDRR